MTTQQEQEEINRLLKVAKEWVGTRYVDHAGVKGVGCDCAGYLKGVTIEAGLVDEFTTPYYHPQQWMRRGFEDRTYLDIVLAVADEIKESEVRPGDIVMYRMVNSWTHGGFVVRWPDYVLHSIQKGVIGSHGTQEGFLRNRPRRFFRLKRWMQNVQGLDAK